MVCTIPISSGTVRAALARPLGHSSHPPEACPPPGGVGTICGQRRSPPSGSKAESARAGARPVQLRDLDMPKRSVPPCVSPPRPVSPGCAQLGERSPRGAPGAKWPPRARFEKRLPTEHTRRASLGPGPKDRGRSRTCPCPEATSSKGTSGGQSQGGRGHRWGRDSDSAAPSRRPNAKASQQHVDQKRFILNI